MYSTLYPCADCARAIVQSGITHLVCPEPDWSGDRYAEHFAIAREILAERGVSVTFVAPPQRPVPAQVTINCNELDPALIAALAGARV